MGSTFAARGAGTQVAIRATTGKIAATMAEDRVYDLLQLRQYKVCLCLGQPVLQCLTQRLNRGVLAKLTDLLIRHDVQKSHMLANCAYHL